MQTQPLSYQPRLGRFAVVAASLLAWAVTLPVTAQVAPAPATTPSATTTPAATTDNSATGPVVSLDAFTVTAGFRGSLAAAAAAKENSPAITEVIASEDIGKLPDVSIADSLTRLTGLTTQRTNGRSQGISIRGLTGDFSTGMLNGREQVSTGENRAVEFDQYPAELLNGVTVYKTAAANLTGQGLAGTIDLETVHPLSKSGRTIAVNGYYEWTQFSQLTPGAKANGNRFNLSYVDQLAGGTIGVALGYSHSSKPYEGEQFQAWGYPTDAAGNFALGGTKSYVRTSNLDRDGLMAVVEYKPNENFHSTIDIYTSKFEEKQLLRGMEIPMAFWSGAALTPGYTVSGGLITQSNLTNVQPVVRNDVFDRHDSPFAFGWNVQVGQKTDWPITFDMGYSRVTRTDENLETYSGVGFRGTAANPDTMNVTLIPGNLPVIKSTLDYSTGSILKLSDPQGWGPTTLQGGGMEGYLKYFQARDELGQFKLSTTHALKGIFKDFEIGTSFSERYKKDGENPSGYINSVTAANTQALPAKVGTTDMSFLGLGPIYAYDPLAAYSAGTWGFTPNYSTDMAVNTFQVTEKIAQLYGQLNLDTKINDVPVTGNIGVRIINTNQNSTGYSANAGILNPASGGDKYTKVAPSMNLTFKASPDTFIRFSVARQLARPRMYDMRASQSWSYDPTLAASTDLSRSPWSGGGGNVKLQPWQANSVDLSFEKYFADNMGYISLAAFHKDLISYIYNQTVLQSFVGYPVRTGNPPVLNSGPAGEPMNGTGGKMQGLEFTWSLPS